MKNSFKTILLLLCLPFLLIACEIQEGTPSPPSIGQPILDLNGPQHNFQIDIPVGIRTVPAYLSKPDGQISELVIVLHGGSASFEASHASTLAQAEIQDGGGQFIQAGYGILALQYTEFAGPEDLIGVTKGFMEMEEVLATVDFVRNGMLAPFNLNIQKLYAFGHSRGGANALLAGIGRPLDAVISAEGPINWLQIRDSMLARAFYPPPTPEEIANFRLTTAEWNDPDEDPRLWIRYSPALQIEHFQSPCLVIQGETDRAAFAELAEEMELSFEACLNCNTEAEFIIHPWGHTDWGQQPVLDSIQNFLNRH